MVARAVIAHCGALGDSVSAVTREQLDIADADSISEILSDFEPDAVINCAAFTDVDAAESDQRSAELSNAVGVENLAAGCRQLASRFVTISTDYVFDGNYDGFYTQRDTPNPLSVYGKTKLDGEVRARNTYARSIVVRSGWIFGSGGTNFLSVVHKWLAKGDGIKAISDTYGTPTFAGDLAGRLRELAELDLPGIYHVTNDGTGTTYAGFARTVCELSGIDTKLVRDIVDRDLNRAAPRPLNSKLACIFSERLGLQPLPQWEKALEGFLATDRSSNR